MIHATGRRRFSRTCACCSEPRQTAITVSRRNFIAGGVAALGLGAVPAGFGFTPAFAQAKPHRIDVHHHVSPPAWIDAVKKAKRDNPPMANWSVQKSLEDMDKAGVATSIVSPTTPQLNFLANDKDTAAQIARESNEYVRKLISDHPGRFGMFAMLPLPHVDESLKEIEHVFGTLQADGIGTMTSFGDKWLGYPQFAPLLEELNRRKATVYTHPTGANCCVNLVEGIPEAAIEFGTDTTRTIASLVFSGASQRYKDINWIFSHGGGSLTAFSERFLVQLPNREYKGKLTREAVDGELKRFYYDTAQVANPVVMAALRKLVPMSQIVFGTDFPYRTAADHVKGLSDVFSAEEMKAIDRDNALKLVPRLRTV